MSCMGLSLLLMEQSMDSLRNKHRFPNCLYRASHVGKAVQEKPCVERSFWGPWTLLGGQCPAPQ